jgi:hypothetical protein
VLDPQQRRQNDTDREGTVGSGSGRRGSSSVTGVGGATGTTGAGGLRSVTGTRTEAGDVHSEVGAEVRGSGTSAMNIETMISTLAQSDGRDFTATTDAAEILPSSRIESAISALRQNPDALKNGQRLTRALRVKGVIGQGQEVIGIFAGRAVVAPASGLVPE